MSKKYNQPSCEGEEDGFEPFPFVTDLLKKTKDGVFVAWGVKPEESVFKDINTAPNQTPLQIQKSEKISSRDFKGTNIFPFISTLFDENGASIGYLDTGSEVIFESIGTHFSTFSIQDDTTGKYQAYIKIYGTIDGDIIQPKEGYVRAPWLDARMNPDLMREKIAPSVQKKDALFDGYYGMDGKILLASTVQKVAVDYFGKKILPQILSTLRESVSQKRSDITKEVMMTYISMQSTVAYPLYRDLLNKYRIYSDISELYARGQDISGLGAFQIFITQIQPKPEWQIILQQATLLERQTKKNKYR